MTNLDDNKAETRTVELIPQPHGGALLPGGRRGNKGGGRPREAIREEFRQILTDKGLAKLREIMDAPRCYVQTCECGRESLIKPPTTDDTVLRALDLGAKYGVGTRQEVEYGGHITLIHDTGRSSL